MPIKIGSHFTEEILELYALGQLPEATIASVEEHMLVCEHCQARLEQVDQFLKLTATAAHELQMEEREASKKLAEKPKPLFSWIWPMPKMAWAGALATAVLAVGISYRPPQSEGIVTDVSFQATRGAESALVSQAPAGFLNLRIDASELPQLRFYRLQLVASNGSSVWESSVEPTNRQIRAHVPTRVSKGRYWVRLYDKGDLLREFGLSVN